VPELPYVVCGSISILAGILAGVRLMGNPAARTE